MKVVICNTLYPPDGIGGPERSVKLTAEALVARGHEVTVIGQGFHIRDAILDAGGGVKRVAIGCPPGYQPVIADRRGHLRDLKRRLFKSQSFDLVARYHDLILKEEPDVVHTNVVHAIDRLWRSVHPFQIPLVHTLRIYNLMCDMRMYYQGAECRFQCPPCRSKFVKRIQSSNLVTTVVGISEYVLQRHLDEGFFARTPRKAVIGNPYDGEPLSRAAHTRSRPRLLFMGRIHPSKGVRLFAELVKSMPGAFSYRICGEGHESYEREIRALVAGCEVEWKGFTSHDEAFEGVDWLVVPSVWGEPFGRVVVEAFAHGIPVIASTRGAFPELIHHGKNGLLFDPDEQGALEKVARQIADSEVDYEAFGKAAVEAGRLYASAEIAKQYEATYEAAIEERGLVRS